MKKLFLIVLITSLLLLGCVQQPPPAPTPALTTTPSPAVSPTPAPTEEPLPPEVVSEEQAPDGLDEALQELEQLS